MIFVPLIKTESLREYIQPNQPNQRATAKEEEMEPWEKVDTEGLFKWVRRKKKEPRDVGGEVVFFNREELGRHPSLPKT